MSPDYPPSGTGVFDAVVDELVHLERQHGLARVMAMGRLILERFFDGSPEQWRARSRNKNNSIRRLAAHPNCPVSRSGLNHAVGVAVALRDIPQVLEMRHVGASHVGVVVPLPTAERTHWLELADAQRLSVRELRDAITRHRREQGDRRGRPRATESERALSAATRATATLSDCLEQLLTSPLDHRYEPRVRELEVTLEDSLVRVRTALAKKSDLRLAYPLLGSSDSDLAAAVNST